MPTGIEWTDETLNWASGCNRTSPGCDHCYALTLAKRLKAMGQRNYQADGDSVTSGPGFGLRLHPDVFAHPAHWRQPRKVFVNSMSDTFHPGIPRDQLAVAWAAMGIIPQHTYQILTKRPERYMHVLERPLPLRRRAPAWHRLPPPGRRPQPPAGPQPLPSGRRAGPLAAGQRVAWHLDRVRRLRPPRRRPPSRTRSHALPQP